MRAGVVTSLAVCLLAGCSLFTDLGGVSGEEPAVLPPGTGQDGGSGGTNEDAGVTGRPPSGTFSVEVVPSRIYLDPGEQNVPVHLTLKRNEGFVAPVTITWNGLPSSVTPSSLTFAGPTTSGDVMLAAQADAKATTAGAKVLAVAGNDAAEIPVSVFVTGDLDVFANDGAFTVPSPAPPELAILAWGGGGGGGSINRSTNGSPYAGGNGGAGAWAGGLVAFAPNDKLDIRVGKGGEVTPQGGGSGGGYSSVTKDTTLLLLAAGGGGGGSGYAETNAANGTAGGAGGAATGANGGGGRGGTAAAGGAADTCGKAACDGTPPSAGAKLTGGTAGYSGGATNTLAAGGAPGGGATANRAPSGGGGGGGWFGGGGGGYRIDDPSFIVYHGNGGGGGSSYADATLVKPLTPTSTALVLGGNGPTPPRTNDPRYRPALAIGGAGAVNGASPATAGGNGRVVIVLAKP